MNQTFGKIIKIGLIISLVILAGLLILGFVLALDWPWWISFFITIGLAGIIFGILLIKKKWLNYREKHFVEQIIAQDETSFDSGSGEKEKNIELKDRWNEAMRELKQSRLKDQGNPLYVLPWYMIIGESGSGKTTAIESAGLDSQFAQVNRVSGLSGTKNCDWWFFDEAIILDTAGRYAVPVDENRDKDEWQTFLTHLTKYRKKEPINGLIVTIPVDKLLNSSPSDMEAYGNNIRNRMEELMLVLGATFPIHLMVTKCDLIKGMTEFCDYLPENSLNQAMGLLNNDQATDSIVFVDRVMASVGDRLRDLRLILCQNKNTGTTEYGIDPSFLLFPEEFESIKEALISFVKGAFLSNRYQENSFLRGIFFSSGRQEGTPYSHFLKDLGLIENEKVLPGTNKGLFLHDYFARILPKERELYAPTKRAIELNRVTKNLWLASWIAIIIAICGMLSFSFMKNVRALNKISHELSETSFVKGDLLSDVIILDRFRQAIIDVNEQNKNWWIPRLGLNESKNIEDDLKKEYCRRFNDAFLQSLYTKQINTRMTHFNNETPDDVVGLHIAFIVRRINLLKNAIRGDELELLEQAPQPDGEVLLYGNNAIPEVMQKLEGLYLYYIHWGRDYMDLQKEVLPLQTWLKHLVAQNDIPLNWIVAWINKNPEMKGFVLDDFWGGRNKIEDMETTIPPSYTMKGKENVDAFLIELETALPDPLLVAGKKLKFKHWYKNEYLNSWYNFGTHFPKGSEQLAGKEEWLQVAKKMPTENGPYFLLFDQMSTELLPLADENSPPWVAMVSEFISIRSQGEKLNAAQKKTGIINLSNKGRSIVNKLRRIDSETDIGVSPPQVFNEYINSLVQIGEKTPSRKILYDLSEKTYNGDPVTSESPFWIAKNSVELLRSSLKSLDTSDKMFWSLVSGPLDYLWKFTQRETGCHLQELWEDNVLVEIQGITDQRALNAILLGKGGIAKKFISGPVKPFISRDRRKGYQAKNIFDQHINFTDPFLTFFTKSDRAPKVIKDNYTVAIKGLPTDVNDNAKLRPHATILELQCGDEIQILKNLNYPVRKKFQWSPNNCADVTLKIEIGNFTLAKKYTGFRQFSKFLQHFSSGHVTFHPSDFPDQKAKIKRLGIKYITVKYQFSGNWPVIKLLDIASGTAPEEIVDCWGYSN